MRNTGKDRLTALVDKAFDDATEEVLPSDQAKLAQFQKLALSLRTNHYDAPSEAISRAYRLVPKPIRRKLTLRILGTTMGLAGARFESGDEIQVLLEADGVRVRLMYGRTQQGWEIIGKVDESGWTAICSTQEAVCEPEGRFKFTVSSLGDTSLKLYSPTSEFGIPPFEELASGASGLDRPN